MAEDRRPLTTDAARSPARTHPAERSIEGPRPVPYRLLLAGGLRQQCQRLGDPEVLVPTQVPTVLTLNACCNAAASPSETPDKALTGALRISS
jgi:hypothetical protein